MLIAVLNQSTLSDKDVSLMTQAVQKQITLHVAPAWNERTASVKFYDKTKKVPAHAWIVRIIDEPDVANALGYHSEDNDLIDAFIFVNPVLDNGGVVLYDSADPQNVSVASVLSHEVCEMFLDRFANFWADGPALTQGSEYALELCDPVENNSYTIDVNGVKVSVSNFVFPSWFNIEAKVPDNMPFDYMKQLSKPFTMTRGGYMIIRKSGKEAQIFGAEMPAWKIAQKKSNYYRRPVALTFFEKIIAFIKGLF